MNGHHSSKLYQMITAAIRTLTFLQALSSPCIIKNCSKSFWQEWNAVTFTVSSTISHYWSLEDNSSALFFSSARYLIRTERSLCLILCGSAEFKIRKNSRSLGVDGYTWPLRSLPELVNQSQFSIFNAIFMVPTSKLATISYFHFRNFLHVVEWQHSPPHSNWWGVENSATCYKLLYGEKKKAKYNCLWIFFQQKGVAWPHKNDSYFWSNL